ncbi:MAG: hypothetical protein QOH50_3462 [Kribbellaceae bacterium]|nr:hypothetical protein [Kribbellaceae bacterium]
MNLLRKALGITAVTLLSLAGAVIPAPAGAAGMTGSVDLATPSPAAKKLFTIHDSRIKESSGLIKSQKYAGTWWTSNDSGDTARIFGVNQNGDVKAVLTFKAPVQDVEALAIDSDGTIYIADIGDNKSSRQMISVYTIPEPAKLENQRMKFHRYDFVYPDGAHDAETLLIQPDTHRLYLVTKVANGKGAFYAAPAQASVKGTNDLTRLADAPPGITDGTFLPDGKSLVLRSYVDIALLSWGPKPNVQARSAVPLSQGESVAIGPSTTSLVVGSEGANSIVYQVQIPVRKATSTAAATPTATNASGGSKNHNLRWILIGAALFALFVTIVTFPRGRRERRDRMMENARLTGQLPPDQPRRRTTV